MKMLCLKPGNLGRTGISELYDKLDALTGRLHRKRLYLMMHHIALNPSQARIFFPSA